MKNNYRLIASLTLLVCLCFAPTLRIAAQTTTETHTPAAPPNDGKMHDMTITLLNGTSVSYTLTELDSVTFLDGIGMKVYTMQNAGTSVDYLFSQMSKVDYLVERQHDDLDTNANANWNILLNDYGDVPTAAEGQLLTPVSGATRNMAWRLEYPRLNTDGTSQVNVWATNAYGVTLSLEWDNDKVANRWTCYQMHDGLPNNSVGRDDTWKEDPYIPTATRSVDADYKGSGYSRGHLCPSMDRQSARDQNAQTFYFSNAHPQWQSHNGGIWEKIEKVVNGWGFNSSVRDTLYVVKAATIDDVVLNGATSDGIYAQKCNGRLIVPKYFYMAVLKVKNGKYSAIGFWTEHTNDAQSSNTPAKCAISIDELERRTGIDFFCNLPDAIENEVEASFQLSDWGL